MAKEWLTDELDKQPYVYNKELLDMLKNNIDSVIGKINTFFDSTPEAKEIITGEKAHEIRFKRNALSYLELETNETLDIVPKQAKTESERLYEEQQLRQLKAYISACKYEYTKARDPHSYLDENLCVRFNYEILQGDNERGEKQRFRLRNASDPLLMFGKGYFAPVDGDKVGRRLSMLIYDFENRWKDDNIFARCAKFIVEYVRIQPHMDGNKRVALMISNYILEKNGYGDIYFKKSQKDNLYEQIKQGMLTRDVTGLASLIADSMRLRYNEEVKQIIEFKMRNLGENINEDVNI